MKGLQTEIFACSGRRGTGKSTLMAFKLERSSRIVLFDPLGEHGHWCPNPIYSIGKLEDFLDWSHSQQKFACRYIPLGEPLEEFEDFCAAVYWRGSLTVGIEEISLVCSSPSAMPGEFGKLIRLSRHRGLNVCWTAQRFAEVPRTLTALTDVFAIFGVSEPRDLDALADRTSPEIADRVASLKLHDGIMFDVRDRSALRVTSHGEILGTLKESAFNSFAENE
ncbi:MAG: hypothetical protein ACYDDI_17545 [Candidatus Acidiferrales bacterium]